MHNFSLKQAGYLVLLAFALGGVAPALQAADKQGVVIQVSDKDMHQSVAYVPAGVIEIIKKEKAGWAYIRP